MAPRRLRSVDDGPRKLVEISKSVCAIDGSTGGDRADAFEGPDGRLHVLIFDLCGHGASTAEIADMALYTVRTLLWQGMTPGMAFTSLNRLVLDLYSRHNDTSFGTGAILSLNAQRSMATFCSAGHVDVLNFHTDATHAHHPSTGPMFGVLEHAHYQERMLPLRAGDVFVMVTDGLLDVRPVEDNSRHLGTSGMCRIVREALASRVGFCAERLISVVRRVAGGAFTDDVAAVVAATRQAGLFSVPPA